MKLNIYNWSYVDFDSPAGRHPVTAEELTWCMRDLRDVLLKESDWILGNDSPVADDVKYQWIAWRQWMRDITKHVSPQDGDKYVEIPNPPAYAPQSWINVTYIESETPEL